jgi:threonine/homoserine/homoserine lactone efflux protein
MFNPQELLLFAAGSFAMIVVPGPAVLYIVTRSIDQGRLAGFFSVLGIAAGSLVHIFGAAAGLSALLAQSATAFNIVKYAGAAYLIYLGVRKLLSPAPPLPTDAELDIDTSMSLRAIFWQGVFVNVLNPKAAIFFVAFLPQFVHPEAGSATLQILVLGFIFNTIALTSDSAYALIAGTVRGWLRKSAGFNWAQRYVSGSIYVALGVGAALSGSNRSS